MVAGSEVLRHRQPWMSAAGFTIRAVMILAVWAVLSWRARRPHVIRLGGLEAAGLVLLLATTTMAAADWVTSLEVEWSSTVHGLIFWSGQTISGLCVVIVVAAAFPAETGLDGKRLYDLGQLLLALTLFWVYVVFSQYLIQWNGNLPEEAAHILARRAGGRQLAQGILLVLEAGVPFAVLLSYGAKRSRGVMAGVAVLVLVARAFDLRLDLGPSIDPGRILPGPLDLAALLALGGAWVWIFLRRLSPLLERPGPDVAARSAP